MRFGVGRRRNGWRGRSEGEGRAKGTTARPTFPETQPAPTPYPVVLPPELPLCLQVARSHKGIVELHPGQKAIIASGFSETDRVKEVQSLGAAAYIRKPFLLEKIGVAVKRELEK